MRAKCAAAFLGALFLNSGVCLAQNALLAPESPISAYPPEESYSDSADAYYFEGSEEGLVEATGPFDDLEPIDDGSVAIHEANQEIDGEPVEAPSYVEQMVLAPDADAAAPNGLCVSRWYGCSDNGCANVFPNEKSCTATQTLATGTVCTYTITKSSSFCNSDADCACQVKTTTSISNWSVLMGCPKPGTQTVTCNPV